MRVVAVTDIHASMRNVRALRDIKRDITVVAGDLASCGSLDETKEVLEELVSQGSPVVWVPGNCDSPRALELKLQGAHLVHESVKEIGGLIFAGLGGSIYTPFNTPFEYSDEELGEKLAPVLAKIGAEKMNKTILVVHNPPYKSGLDTVRGGEYVGSKNLRKLIESYQPRLLITGHIHESPGVTSIGRTLAVNPGPLQRGHYALILIDAVNEVYVVRMKKL